MTEKRTRKWYVADFETTSAKYYEKNKCTKVWLYSICDNNANIINDGSCIEEFINYVKKLAGKIIYFHNLKFDGSFIIDYLLRNGYTFYDNLKDIDKGFSTLIGDRGQFYSLTIKFSKKCQVSFYDSLKLLPFKVEKIAKDFNLPILKEEINYDDYVIDAKRLEYVHHDVQIVAMALNIIKNEGMNKMTTASCAFSQYTSNKSDAFLNQAFPELNSDFLLEWRLAYRGGRSQVNPYYKGKILHNVNRYDVNSMYPNVMMNCLLPYGYPIICDKPKTYDFELYDIDVSFDLKKNHMPSLLKKSFALLNVCDTYYSSSGGVINLHISSIDFELLERNYDIYYLKFNKIYGFLTTKMLFTDYINKWYSKKKVDKGAQRIVDKLMLNSLYGKFGSNCKGKHKIPKLKDDSVIFENSDEEDMKKYYLPVAIAITSYAHKILDDAIQSTGITNFVYCDTDSVHTLGTLDKTMVDATELGKFKLEGIETCAKYVRQKCYVINDDNGLSIICAGMPEDLKEKALNKYGNDIFKVFKEGFTMEGKLLPKHVKGGVILYATTFEIKRDIVS